MQSQMMSGSAPRRVGVVRRDAIETLRSIVVDGVEHNLGIHKDFRRHPDLLRFIPDRSRLSMSWVRLEEYEVLEPHQHEVESMIVVCSGSGEVMGDLKGDLHEGDIVMVPRNCLHGFRGGRGTGFWALSVQFEGTGLYEEAGSPRVRFGQDSAGASAHSPGFDRLMQRNERFVQEYAANDLVRLIQSSKIVEPECRARFLDCLQLWSDQFQKVIMSRVIHTDEPAYAHIFTTHLIEEFGHNRMLAAARPSNRATLWDPVLEAASNWFVSKMSSANNADKLVLVQLVLEAAGSVFHRVARVRLAALERTEYFALHDEADDSHEEMGLELVKNLTPAAYEHLYVVQEQGWRMFNLLCTRLAQLAQSEA